MSVYLYDMGGRTIAMRRSWTDQHLFDADGHWIGWFPWEDNDAVDLAGRYLGTVVGDRLVRRNDLCERPCSVRPPDPGRAEPTGQPLPPLYFPNRFAYDDVRLPHHA
ncbi:hypothetical protein [Aeromicrobium wangtongii]|uniref:RHS repeat-associated core domain-containing protein n=1 Tax=Aeromicrobium wangtongii TaxID=2969247 RepID=A0ABY5M954_9ACTN|nr:hypothetical protein [Aeromicrobium wangtongii]MCD9199283.1 hypothetical protein [Aeromicrobium wangtongii]UUP13644.1 hypothetical protein NQV15_17615 [Aeromicrobium wangtongii]